MIPGEQRVMPTSYITKDQEQADIEERQIPVAFGYIEWTDIFGTIYTARYCALLHKVYDPVARRLTNELPGRVAFPCNSRTQKPKN